MNDIPNGPVLVTGGTGFLARHTILLLLERGFAVRTTVRSQAKAGALKQVLAAAGADTARLHMVEANLLAAEGWPGAVDGVRAVLHMATPMAGGDVIAAALEGTRHVLEASARAGVERIVVTSSGLAAAPRGRTAATELDWTDPDGPGTTRYASAKTMAERLAWDLAARHGLKLTTILPGVMLGPALGPDRPAWLGLIQSMLAGTLPALPPVDLHLVDVRDAAALHIEALIQPAAAGQRYLAAGETLSLRDIALILKSGPHRQKVSTREMPVWLLRLLALFNADVRQLAALRKAPSMDAAKAMKELGWHPRPARQTILDAAASLS